MNPDILELARNLGSILKKRNLQCAVAESCTGGSLAAAITEIEGSSQWFDRGFVTYSNQAKEELLGVDHSIITQWGAVSRETAEAMAVGAILNSSAEISTAITGIAGPTGGTQDKPVGMVWIAWAGDQKSIETKCYNFQGDRKSIREQAVLAALRGLIERCVTPISSLKSKDRYFFALYPSPEIVNELSQQAQPLLLRCECRSTPREKLHMTLVYLGQVLDSVLQDSIQFVNQQKSKKFRLEIATDGYWSHKKIRWLGVKESPSELLKLITGLKRSLVTAGFKPEMAAFVPHITIARDCQTTYGKILDPIVWQVMDFYLLKSTNSNPSYYEIIHRWKLN